jgi:hypothetical protein
LQLYTASATLENNVNNFRVRVVVYDSF